MCVSARDLGGRGERESNGLMRYWLQGAEGKSEEIFRTTGPLRIIIECCCCL